jgi:hypothetical protein
MSDLGRPSKYSQDIADEICDLISSTSHGLQKICDSDDKFPSAKTVYAWLREHEDFRNNYARARECQADLLADEIIHIADTFVVGQKTVSKATGLEITEGDTVDRSRLMVDARKWKASKLAPKKYGDKLDVTSDGEKIAAMLPVFPTKKTEGADVG